MVICGRTLFLSGSCLHWLLRVLGYLHILSLYLIYHSHSANLTLLLFFLKAIFSFPSTPVINPNWSLQPHVSTLLSSPVTLTRNTLCSLSLSPPSTCCSLSLVLSSQPLSFHLVNSYLSWWSKLPWHPLQEVFSYCLIGEKMPIICAPSVPYAYSYHRVCTTVIIAFKCFHLLPQAVSISSLLYSQCPIKHLAS